MPKSERTRNPKSEIAFRAVGTEMRFALVQTGRLRSSAFGFLSTFGFRTSDFELGPSLVGFLLSV